MEFELTRASATTLIAPLLVVAVTLAIAGFYGWIAWSINRSSVEVEGGALQLHVPMYGRSIPVSSLDLSSAAIVEVKKGSPYRPTGRTNGIGLPGFAVGWFKLNDGSKALLAITDRSRVVRIPTGEGYSLLVSVADPEGLLARLRASS